MGITLPLEGLKRTKRHRKGRLELSAGAETALSPYSQTSALLVLRPLYLTRSWIIGSHGPPALGFGKELHYLLPWASELQTSDHGTSQPSEWHTPIPKNKSLRVSICILLVLFLYRNMTVTHKLDGFLVTTNHMWLEKKLPQGPNFSLSGILGK